MYIEVGKSFEDAERESRIKPLPNGEYRVQVVSAEVKTSGKGEPMIDWRLDLAGNPEFNGRVLFHTTPLAGRGIGLMSAFAKATGKPWAGTGIDTDAYIGSELRVETKIQVQKEDGKYYFVSEAEAEGYDKAYNKVVKVKEV